MKKRVKCANCGMIYDHVTAIENTSEKVTSYDELQENCPACGSNARD